MEDGNGVTLSDVLERWHRRFERSISVYDEAFAEQGFDDLIVVVVTATYIEGLLWLGVQFTGFDPAKGKKQMTLGPLISRAATHGVIGPDLEPLLRAFSKMRNHFAHDPDYRLEGHRVEDIRLALPTQSRATLDRVANIIPYVPDGTKARLVLEQLVKLTFEAVADAHRRAYGGEEANESTE